MLRLELTLLALVPCAVLSAAACGGDSSTATGGTGDTSTTGTGTGSGGAGGTGGEGGSGGAACVPESEQCDGVDNDCDGTVDEDCPCTDGQTQPCYSGPMGTQGIGACAAGMQTCSLAGTWGACTGEVVPAVEACNGVDDDCNGSVDDMGMTSCGIGACAASVLACDNGVPGACVPGQPSVELCDGIDNDCDQLLDESFPDEGTACDSGLLGACQAGALACVTENGTTAPKCVPDLQPVNETCDGIDNDCNGTVDDNVPGTGGACSTGALGPCAAGTIACQGGVIDCFANVTPSPETCDGVDNDCNGTVDDPPGVNQPCNTGLLGICQAGINQCQNGSFTCVQQQLAQPTDVCGDNLDNNCNGQTDEGCLYTFSGVQTNLPVQQLTGWTQCYLDTYANNATPLTTILTQCNKAKLLLACRVTGSQTLMAAAWAPRLDVTFDTGTGNVPHNANGVGWYYNNSWSWGFAQQGDAITRNSCDTTNTNADKRLCWHTGSGSINTGWRCGATTGLNFIATHERIVFHAD